MENVFIINGSVDFDFEKYFSMLNTNLLGRKVIYFETVSSTNDFAKEYAKAGEWGLCILAEEQTKGRGTHGRKWITYKGQSVAVSMILHPDWIKDSSFISITAAKAIVNALAKFNVFANIKYPNDIYLNNRKLAGILVETFYSSKKADCVILGIGININQTQFDDELKDNAISLKQFLGYEIAREELLAALLNELSTIEH